MMEELLDVCSPDQSSEIALAAIEDTVHELVLWREGGSQLSMNSSCGGRAAPSCP